MLVKRNILYSKSWGGVGVMATPRGTQRLFLNCTAGERVLPDLLQGCCIARNQTVSSACQMFTLAPN